MGRTLPSECQHGTTVDWGDFGPCQDCSEHDDGSCPNYAACDKCEAERHPSGLSGRLVADLRDRGWELTRVPAPKGEQ